MSTHSTQSEIAAPKPIPFGSIGLCFGVAALVLALVATALAAVLESEDWLSYATSLWDQEISETRSYLWLRLVYGALGVVAISCALVEAHLRRMNWTARFGLILGVIALAWKWVLWGIVIAVAVAILLNVS
ncbi:MAG: hypothetical protein SGI99_07240 [Pseudomonadota bacterium]|nr:hypothetical protein [Pseudomonadota bacterium]